MIPFLLAAVGGYLIGQARKDEQYAKGGVLEHGLRKGDTIVSEMANYAGVLNDETGEAALINIETGERIVQ